MPYNAQIHALNPIDYQPKTQTNSPNEPTDKIHLQNTIVPSENPASTETEGT